MTTVHNTDLIAPCTWFVAGPSGSGKTVHVMKAINDGYFSLPINNVFWFYGIWQTKYGNVPQVPNYIFKEGLPPVDFLNGVNKTVHNVIVIDDLMSEMNGKGGDIVTKLFTRGSHHANVSVIVIVQNMYFKGGREMKLNSSYMTLFRNPADMSVVASLAKQMNPSGKKGALFVDVYKDATSKPFGYLFLSLKADSPDSLKLRTNVFGEGDQISYTIE